MKMFLAILTVLLMVTSGMRIHVELIVDNNVITCEIKYLRI